MNWNFSLGWMFLGLLILIGGALMVVFYQPISDNFASGVSSYKSVKKWGLIIAGVGLLVMSNLHTLLLTAFVNIVFLR